MPPEMMPEEAFWSWYRLANGTPEERDELLQTKARDLIARYGDDKVRLEFDAAGKARELKVDFGGDRGWETTHSQRIPDKVSDAFMMRAGDLLTKGASEPEMADLPGRLVASVKGSDTDRLKYWKATKGEDNAIAVPDGEGAMRILVRDKPDQGWRFVDASVDKKEIAAALAAGWGGPIGLAAAPFISQELVGDVADKGADIAKFGIQTAADVFAAEKAAERGVPPSAAVMATDAVVAPLLEVGQEALARATPGGSSTSAEDLVNRSVLNALSSMAPQAVGLGFSVLGEAVSPASRATRSALQEVVPPRFAGEVGGELATGRQAAAQLEEVAARSGVTPGFATLTGTPSAKAQLAKAVANPKTGGQVSSGILNEFDQLGKHVDRTIEEIAPNLRGSWSKGKMDTLAAGLDAYESRVRAALPKMDAQTAARAELSIQAKRDAAVKGIMGENFEPDAFIRKAWTDDITPYELQRNLDMIDKVSPGIGQRMRQDAARQILEAATPSGSSKLGVIQKGGKVDRVTGFVPSKFSDIAGSPRGAEKLGILIGHDPRAVQAINDALELSRNMQDLEGLVLKGAQPREIESIKDLFLNLRNNFEAKAGKAAMDPEGAQILAKLKRAKYKIGATDILRSLSRLMAIGAAEKLDDSEATPDQALYDALGMKQ